MLADSTTGGQRHARGLGAPHAQARRFESELPWLMVGIVSDFIDPDRIFKHHSVRSFEIQKPRPGCRMAPGAKHDRHTAFAQEIIGTQHVIAGLYLMIDMLDAGMRRSHQCNGVMDGVDAHQGNIADPVADARVAYLRPKSFIACGIGRVETDVAEAGDARVARREITPAIAL